MEFPRKRAQVACNFCRHRGSVMGRDPHARSALARTLNVYIRRTPMRSITSSGSLLAHLAKECDRLDADLPAEIVLRLDRLESLVKQQTNVISALSDHLLAFTDRDHNPLAPSRSTILHRDGVSHASPLHKSRASHTMASIDSRMRYEYNNDPFLIPLGHQTPTGNLNLIGDYSQDFFLFLESERSLRPLAPQVPYSAILAKLTANRETTDFLISSFCNYVHLHFPILELESLHEMIETFLQSSEGRTSSDALCLIILALGEICSTTVNVYDTESQTDSNGTECFAHAYQILATEGLTLFSRDVKVPLAYFFGSIYFRYRGRALEAWKMIHAASSGVQLMFSYLRGRTIPQEQRDLLIRLCWSCYVLEWYLFCLCSKLPIVLIIQTSSDDLAEFHFPRSGIEILVDGLPFPEFTDLTDRNSLVFLAMCSIRKLLNRIHNTIYAGKIETDPSKSQHHPVSVASLETLNIELSRQLKTWFDSLPESIKPNLQDPNPRDVHDRLLRLRYYAAKHILYRPSLVFAAQSKEIQLTAYLIENCKICVDSCRKFILTTVPFIKKRTHGTGLRLQALLAAVFVLSIAKATPSLAFLVPDFDAVIEEAIQSTELWAQYHETADTILNIFKSIRRKLRFHVEYICA
ncbi:transcriptional regulator family: Fungal Specific TF [Penicillium maclennaniae]|uniref:transcriptional regulator family: Fungal Specific TF n=1 Tax=Penicillium maclennaniae TaxID=1343394 RepID=UPI0025414B61|nr:transcriptional regulator family: Fungal Specific TF [Penicillium maclennaniae]KAJ5677726.1 transcriptional regulator family: Fungal Specific TF [Penicillium maclennaniae]